MNDSVYDDLIIVTYKRPKELYSCLESVAAQSHMPASVIVVEGISSTSNSIPTDLEVLLGDRLKHVFSEPGMTKQRNIGIGLASGSIVHFIDDDVILEPDYFEHVLDVFNSDESRSIGGVGGLITNLPDHTSSVLRSLLMLDGPPGSLRPSGKNVLVFDTNDLLDVDWLTGCSMSFRREVFDTERFDESDLRGLGFGDDVDLSARVARRYRLVVTPRARLEHRQSSIGRLVTEDLVAGELTHRSLLAKGKVGGVRRRWFWFSVVGEILLLTGQFLRTMSLEPLRRASLIARSLTRIHKPWKG